ncbi:MAG: endonuclease III, partial [Actinomycetota bacterium]
MEPRAAWLARETPEEKRKRAALIYRRLDGALPDAKCALKFTTPLEMVVSTVLSAQSTDVMVNKISPALFAKYPTPEAYLASPPGELERDIHSTGFFNQKARSIRGLSRVIVEEFGGQVPGTMEGLLRLPGVARKTANIVLGNSFGKVEGIAVDTHVHRLSRRLGFSDEGDTNKVERDLMALYPKKKWFRLTYLLIDHGRTVCLAKAPRCDGCVLNDICPASRVPTSR